MVVWPQRVSALLILKTLEPALNSRQIFEIVCSRIVKVYVQPRQKSKKQTSLAYCDNTVNTRFAVTIIFLL